jgi:hypothetical protein
MRTRVTISLIGLVLVLASLTPLFAGTRDKQTAVCCGGPGDCASDESCCDPVSLGIGDCDTGRPGYCRTTCSRSESPVPAVSNAQTNAGAIK